MHRTTDQTLLRFARRAMATQFEVILPWGTARAETAATDALDLIDRLESQLSVYRETSEVSRLNRIAAYAPVPLERRLFELLQLAERIHYETDGAFDITSGPLIRTWGFFRREGRMPSDLEIESAVHAVGMPLLQFDSDRRRLRFARTGVEINLGSIGKGYALDRAAERLREQWNIDCALLDGGTSSVLALDAPPADSRGWFVGIKHPWEPHRLARIYLRNRAMATSGTSQQNFIYNDRKLGHLIDPRTGWPAEGIALAAAIAPTAAEADALATAFFVLGVDGTQKYCDTNPQVGALLLPDDAEPIAINLPADEFELDDTPLEPSVSAWDTE